MLERIRKPLDDAISFDLGYRSVIGILAQVSNEGRSGTSAKGGRELNLVAAHAVGWLKLLQRVSAWKKSKEIPVYRRRAPRLETYIHILRTV